MTTPPLDPRAIQSETELRDQQPLGRIRVIPLPGRVLLVLDRMPVPDATGTIDWLAARDHLARHGVLALRFAHEIQLEDQP